MNVKENIFRVPIPKNNVEMFVGMVHTFAELCGVNKIPELQHQIDLLSREVDSYLFDKRNGPVRHKAGEEKQRFIIIFKNRFREEYDYEYPNTLKPVDLHMLGDFIAKKLSVNHIDSAFYLEWFFTSFLDEHRYMVPPDIPKSVSSKAWSVFVFEHKEQLKERKEQALVQSEGMDLINRARLVIRNTEDEDIKTKVIEVLKKYKEGSIIISEFRKEVLGLEKAIRQ